MREEIRDILAGTHCDLREADSRSGTAATENLAEYPQIYNNGVDEVLNIKVSGKSLREWIELIEKRERDIEIHSVPEF